MDTTPWAAPITISLLVLIVCSGVVASWLYGLAQRKREELFALQRRRELTDRISMDLEAGAREHLQLVENRFRDMQEAMDMAADIGSNLRLRGLVPTPPKPVPAPKPTLPPVRRTGVRRIRG